MVDRLSTLAAALVLVCVPFATAAAQDRMPRIPADKLADAQKKAVEDFKVARGVEISGPFIPMLRSPEAMTRARAMGDYLRYKSTLPPRLSEFVILIIARHWTQQYEWGSHYAIALKAGLSQDTADAIAEGRRPGAMAEDEAIIYDFCDEMHRNQSITEATYGRLMSKFGEPGVIDTLSIMGYYTLLAMVMNTTRTPLDPGMPSLQPLPR